MSAAVIEGCIMGLFLSIFVGPVFFLLIETSIKYGIRDAFIMNAGVILGDLIWIFVLFWGIDAFLGEYLESPEAMVFAGAVFVVFGVGNLYQLRKKTKANDVIDHKGNLFRKGLILNLVNPSVGLFWSATIALAIQQFDTNKYQITIFFVSLFLTVLTTDLIKFIIADKLRIFFNNHRQNILSLFVSIIMIIFGGYMMLSRYI